ncbi:hypothetical protein, partial [Pseudomonas aeruginosa]|uniref:hypothetical protein n=1 Tax=Pseudomonas aeruginosa TaxID=287 RepID=UPI00402B6748
FPFDKFILALQIKVLGARLGSLRPHHTSLSLSFAILRKRSNSGAFSRLVSSVGFRHNSPPAAFF